MSPITFRVYRQVGFHVGRIFYEEEPECLTKRGVLDAEETGGNGGGGLFWFIHQDRRVQDVRRV